MDKSIRKLIEISGNSIVKDPKIGSFASGNRLINELKDVLLLKNGFYAFDSALLFRPTGASSCPNDLGQWNRPDLWISSYEMNLRGMYFFAEDVFGGQFAITSETIVCFDPETGETEEMSDSFEGWCEALLDDYDYYTGYSLASKWQKENRKLIPGERLVPKQLFVLGGEFDVANLKVQNDAKAMRARGGFASQLKNLPDGTQIEFEFTD